MNCDINKLYKAFNNYMSYGANDFNGLIDYINDIKDDDNNKIYFSDLFTIKDDFGSNIDIEKILHDSNVEMSCNNEDDKLLGHFLNEKVNKISLILIISKIIKYYDNEIKELKEQVKELKLQKNN